jgi:L-serine dehydratase
MAHTSFADLFAATEAYGSLGRAALAREIEETGLDSPALRARMEDDLRVMRDSVAQGLEGQTRSRSGMTGGDAARLASSTSGPTGGSLGRAIARAVAVAEVNAAMGRIVAAPTGGASGVVPGVLLTLAEDHSIPEHDLVDALFAAAAIGGVIAARATLSGATAGCQAEIGAASAMAAAAATEMCGGSPRQAGHAASFALQAQLGLVCDPVAGLVEVPCVARNATGAAIALAAAEMALAGMEFCIPFDQVVDAMASVGRALPSALRETAQGGLAATPAARDLAGRLRSAP